MKKQKILNISKSKYEGYVYNVELDSKSNIDDLYWIEQDSGIVCHNCFPKDLKSFVSWAKKHDCSVDMFEATDKVNERVREVKDWLEIKGATNNKCY